MLMYMYFQQATFFSSYYIEQFLYKLIFTPQNSSAHTHTQACKLHCRLIPYLMCSQLLFKDLHAVGDRHGFCLTHPLLRL